jgi:galactokinase
MSHASRRDEWGGTSAEANFIVEQVETMTLDGIYGACMTGRGGYVILVGQPHALPLGLDPLKAAFEKRFGFVPYAMSL